MLVGIGGFLRAIHPGKGRETAVCPQSSLGINPAQSWINFYLKKKQNSPQTCIPLPHMAII